MPSIRIRLFVRFSLPVAVVVSLSACGAWFPPSPPGAVLFQDDFSRSSSGWDVRRTPNYSSAYEEGRYQIAVFRPNTDAWGNPGVDVADVRIEVDTHQIDGPADNLFGIICRYQDAGNFYFLITSTDGFSGIGLYQGGQRRLISGDAMLPVPGVEPGGSDHHLTGVCDRGGLTLYVDGVLASKATATLWPAGDVGLMAGTYQDSGAVIAFDNFSVLQAGGNVQP